MIKKSVILLVFALGGLLLSRCAQEPPDPVVISLEGRTVPLSEVVYEFDRLNAETSWAQASPAQRKAFVKTFGSKELLVKRVHEVIGTELVGREAREYTRWLDNLEVAVMWDSLVARERTSAAERDSLAALQSHERQMTHVSSRDGDLIAAIGERVAAGEDLLAVGRDFAERHPEKVFLNAGGWVDRTRLPAELADPLFALDEVGAIAGPFDTERYGWHIMRFDGERAVDMEAWAREFEAFMEGGKRRSVISRARERIRQKYAFKVAEESFEPIRRAFEALFDSLAGDDPHQFSADLAALRPPLHRFTEEELALPLVSWNGGAWTLGEFVGSLDDTNIFFWPGIGGDWRIRGRILLRMEQWASRREAHELDVLNDPELARMKDRKRTELLLDRFYDQRVRAQAMEVTREHVVGYWEEHREEYWSDATGVYGYLWVPADARQLADEAVAQLRAGRDWETVGREMAARDTSVDFRALLDEQLAASYAKLTPLVLGFELGEQRPLITDPVEYGEGWVVLSIHSQSPAEMLDFAAAEELARRDLQRELMERRLLDLLDDFAQEYGLVINWEAIE